MEGKNATTAIIPDAYQEKLLQLILDAYERTRSYKGQARQHQNITVPVLSVFPDYDRDDVDLQALEQFEQSMRCLEQATPIRIQYRDRKIRSQFRSFTVPAADVEPALYDLAGRRPKREIHAGEIPVYEAYRGRTALLDRFVDSQEELLRQDRNAWFTPETASDVMKTVDYILHNTADLLFRELSIVLYGDTKYIERRGILHKAVRVLKTFGTYEFSPDDFDTEGAYDAAVLGEYAVYENPSYVCFNGSGSLLFSNGTRMELVPGVPAAIRSDTIPEIVRLEVKDDSFLTVENLTSFNRLQTGMFQVYLAGYHNGARQRFLRKVQEQNPALQHWFHFGDLDPDGFCILENLRRKTGIDFRPWRMGLEELRLYECFGRRLNDNDRRKAAGLLAEGRYVPALQYMLEHDVKLEQEIISWREAGKR